MVVPHASGDVDTVLHGHPAHSHTADRLYGVKFQLTLDHTAIADMLSTTTGHRDFSIYNKAEVLEYIV